MGHTVVMSLSINNPVWELITKAAAAATTGTALGLGFFNNAFNTFYLVIWHWTYDKGPFTEHESKPTGTTLWAKRAKTF